MDIQDYGLIVEFKQETPIFLHQSFAEYFLALNAVENIKQKQDVKDILRQSARKDLDGYYKFENGKSNELGYGIVDAAAAVELMWQVFVQSLSMVASFRGDS